MERIGVCRLIGAALGLGLLARLLLALFFIDLESPTLWEFGRIAENLAATGVYAYYNPHVPTAYIPPGYPVAIAHLYGSFGTGVLAHGVLLAWMLASALIIPLLCGLVARELWGARAGGLALILALFWPRFLLMSGRLHDVPFTTMLMLLACWLSVARSPAIVWRSIGLAVVVGLLANFRFETPLFLLPWLWALHHTRDSIGDADAGGRSRKRPLLRTGLAPVGIVVLGYTMGVAPWVHRNLDAFGTPLLGTSGGFNLLRGHHALASGTGRDPWPAAKLDPNRPTPIPSSPYLESLNYDNPQDEVLADRWYRELALRHMKEHPAREAKLLARKLFYFLVVDTTHPADRLIPMWLPSLAALALGLRHWLRRGRRDRRQTLLWMVFGVQLLLVLATFMLPRYRMCVEFVPLVFAAGALNALWARWERGGLLRRRAWGV